MHKIRQVFLDCFISDGFFLLFVFLYAFGVLLFAVLDRVVPHIYHLTPINVEGNEFKIHGKVLFLWGMFFGPVLLCAVFSRIIFNAKLFLKKHFSDFSILDRTVFVWFCCNVLSFIIGFSLNNEPRYLWGDTFTLSIIPLVYILARSCIVTRLQWNIFFYFVLIIQTALVVTGFLVFYGAYAFVIFAYLVFSLNKKNNRVFYLMLFLLTTEVALLKTRFGFLLQFAFGILLLYAIERRRKGFFRSLFFVFLVFIITRPVFNEIHRDQIDYFSYVRRARVIARMANIESAFGFFKNKTQNDQITASDRLPGNRPVLGDSLRDISADQRLYEARVVMNRLALQKPSAFFFGFGNGATLDLSQTHDDTLKAVYKGGLDRVHSIHLLPFAILYRQGFVGIFQYLILFVALFMSIKQLLNSTQDTAVMIQTEILALYLFVMVVGAFFSASHFSANLLVAVSIGLIGAKYSLNNTRYPDRHQQ